MSYLDYFVSDASPHSALSFQVCFSLGTSPHSQYFSSPHTYSGSITGRVGGLRPPTFPPEEFIQFFPCRRLAPFRFFRRKHGWVGGLRPPGVFYASTHSAFSFEVCFSVGTSPHSQYFSSPHTYSRSITSGVGGLRSPTPPRGRTHPILSMS